MGSFSVWHWLIVMVVVMLVFGTKKLGSAGTDLGNAVREFKAGLKGDDAQPATVAKSITDDSVKTQ